MFDIAQRWRRSLRIGRLVVTFIAMVLGAPGDGAAQAWENPADSARLKAGPLALTPSFEMTRIGVDPNVYNEPSDPTGDFTATVLPGVNVWMRMGSAWLTASTQATYLHFQDLADQRTFSLAQTVRVDVPLNRVRFFVGGGYGSVKDRPGPDIDERARHAITNLTAGLDARLAVTRILSVSARRTTDAFEEDAMSGGTSLATVLNRRSDLFELSLRQDLTPLTSLVLRGRMEQNAFDEEVSRDNVTSQVTAGLSFKPLALLSGEFNAGVMSIGPRGSGDTPEFTGLALDANIRYMLRSSTQFGVLFIRTTNYAADPAVPYYVLTTLGLTVDHRFTPRWDVAVNVQRQAFSYESTVEPVDATYRFNAGVGCRLQPNLRIGVQAVGEGRTVTPGSTVGAYESQFLSTSVTYTF